MKVCIDIGLAFDWFRLIKHCLPLLNELNQSGGLREILQENLTFFPNIFSKILISKINPKFKFFHFFYLKKPSTSSCAPH